MRVLLDGNETQTDPDDLAMGPSIRWGRESRPASSLSLYTGWPTGLLFVLLFFFPLGKVALPLIYFLFGILCYKKPTQEHPWQVIHKKVT